MIGYIDMEDIAKILMDVVPMNYFDLKNLNAVNKMMNSIVSANARVKQTVAHRIYAVVFGHIINVFPGKFKNVNDVMGVKIAFRYQKQVHFASSDASIDVFNPEIEESFVIGISHKLGEEARIYYGNREHFYCMRLPEIHNHRETILRYIDEGIHEVLHFDIYYHNITEGAFNLFLAQLLQIVSKYMPVNSVNLYRENVAENVLIYH
jgi:hypothetical protein